MSHCYFDYFQNSAEIPHNVQKLEDTVISCIFNFDLSAADDAYTNFSKYHCLTAH